MQWLWGTVVSEAFVSGILQDEPLLDATGTLVKMPVGALRGSSGWHGLAGEKSQKAMKAEALKSLLSPSSVTAAGGGQFPSAAQTTTGVVI